MIEAPSAPYLHFLVEELTMDFRERLSKISKTVYLKKSSDLTDLFLFYEVYEDILISSGQKMQEFSSDLLDTLLSLLSSLDISAQKSISSSDEYIQNLVNVLDNLSASFPEPVTGNQSFAKFLWTLSKGEELFAEQNVLQHYDKYIGQMESLSWLFQLEREGQPVYPISNLLNDRILREFDPDSEEDLLYLIASLQLFNQLRDIPNDRRDTVLQLSDQYNLKILEMICNHGQLLFGDSRIDHMRKNKIMGVRCGDKILIRTTDLLRKEPPGVDIEYETNRDRITIAKFFIYKVDPDYELLSLDDYLRSASPSQRMSLFLTCLKDQVYNVFMEDSVIRNSNDHSFYGWVNPSVSDDPFIISYSSHHKIDGGEDSFFSHLDDCAHYWFRPTALVQSGIDRLTIDYMIGFYKIVCKPLNVSLRSILCEENSVWKQEFHQRGDQFAQNLVAKSFFAHAFNHNLEIPKAIMNYASFIKSNYSAYGDISAETRLIFPYSFYIPFANETELLAAMLKNKGKNITSCKLVTLTCRPQSGWRVTGIPGRFTVYDISTLEVIEPFTTYIEYCGLMDDNKDVYILFSPEGRSMLNAFREIMFLSAELIIKEYNRSEYNAFLQRRPLEKLIYDIGIPGELKKLFWPGADANNLARSQLSPLLFFKILHHINAYQITEDKLDAWGKLIFNCHLTAPSSSSDQMYESFRTGVNSRNKDRNCLMISKRSYADKSTLGAILNNAKERFATDSAFDPGALNERIGFNQDIKQYQFKENGKWKQKIARIVFLTDNIISGKSTYQMLSYHFSGQKTFAPTSSYYVKLEDGKTVREIMDVNAPTIELHTVFWFSDLHGCTVYEKSGELYPVDFHVNETERIRFYVRAYQTYPPNAYLYTREAFELARSIYGEEAIPAHNGESENRHLVFRFNNMPGFSVFPKEAQKIRQKIGLFERRK